MLKYYRVYYEEKLSYEEYIEADNPEQAKDIFATTLELNCGLELVPSSMEIIEFEAEEI